MKIVLRLSGFLMGLGVATSLSAAKFQTANFEVTAESSHLAQEIAQEAERCRTVLSRHWLDSPLTNWGFCCRIHVQSRKTEGTGWTTYKFRGETVTRADIRLQGPKDQLLEYVLPHELCHAVLVMAMGKPMPRWADEGAAMLSESESQKLRQRLLVEQLVRAGKVIPIAELLRIDEYPNDDSELHAFYAQSLTLSEFLIENGGRRRYLQFAQEGHLQGWDRSLDRHYQWKNCETLQEVWSQWVLKQAKTRQTK